MTSDPITITVDVAASNDVPQVTQNVDSISLEEDSSGQTVQLQASPGDPMEGNEPLEIFITRLPTRGKVKCSRAHTAAHACTKVQQAQFKFYTAKAHAFTPLVDPSIQASLQSVAAYSEFDLGNVFSQYLNNITDISSYWGGPPMLECSPLILLGGPDCQSFGDCPRDPAIFGSWGGNSTSNPPIGELLYVRFYDAVNGGWAHGYSKGNAPGYLRKIENGTFTVEMVPLWKFDETTIPRQDGSSAPTGGYSYSYSYDGAYNLINNSRHPSVQYKRCRMAPRNNGRMFYPAE
eukprot:2410330-Prymnesium_polylepis.1